MSARTWTASVVITLATAPGCDKSNVDQPTQNPPPATGATGPTSATGPTGTVAPTGAVAPTGQAPDPHISVNPPPPEPEPLTQLKKGNSTISVQENGNCTEFVSVDCPPGVMCNPPPPQDVECPPELQAASDAKNAAAQKKAAADDAAPKG